MYVDVLHDVDYPDASVHVNTDRIRWRRESFEKVFPPASQGIGEGRTGYMPRVSRLFREVTR